MMKTLSLMHGLNPTEGFPVGYAVFLHFQWPKEKLSWNLYIDNFVSYIYQKAKISDNNLVFDYYYPDS